jgi:hypothetical protein
LLNVLALHPNRPAIDGGVAFLMLLFRLAHPVKLRPHMEYVFGYDKTYLCAWTNEVMAFVVDKWGYVLRLDVPYVSSQAQIWAHQIGAKLGQHPGAAMNCRCILFVDGVFRYCCRPGSYEVCVYVRVCVLVVRPAESALCRLP